MLVCKNTSGNNINHLPNKNFFLIKIFALHDGFQHDLLNKNALIQSDKITLFY